jgi:hypothetical protein
MIGALPAECSRRLSDLAMELGASSRFQLGSMAVHRGLLRFDAAVNDPC